MDWQEKYGDGPWRWNYVCRCWTGHFALDRCDDSVDRFTRGAKVREYYDSTHETPCTQLRDPGPMPGTTSCGWPLAIGSKRLDGFFANLIAHRKRWVACRVCHSYMRSWNASSCRTTAMWDVSPKRACAQPGEFCTPLAAATIPGRTLVLSGPLNAPWSLPWWRPCDETLVYWEYGRSTAPRRCRGQSRAFESIASVSCGNPCGTSTRGYGRHATLAG